jgi:hypothetical protein
MCAIRLDWLLLAPGGQGFEVPESFSQLVSVPVGVILKTVPHLEVRGRLPSTCKHVEGGAMMGWDHGLSVSF